jgi:arylsulfatase
MFLTQMSRVPGRLRQPDPGGQAQVRIEFAYDGGGLAKGGDVTLC